MSDRLSIQRGKYDFEPDDKPPDLISFIIRGPRGSEKGHVCMQRKLARRYWITLTKLLGIWDEIKVAASMYEAVAEENSELLALVDKGEKI